MDDAKKAVRKALTAENGVCLITGPTGSGKTTLLYSALAALDRRGLNIVSIEDPVEYTFPGITQIQVSPRLSFADSLRAILRQDPDVILVGEVRDRETAELCFQAAATGHLVLSTLHANSAVDVTRRLQGLGLSLDTINSSLRFSSAQRLLPQICSRCSEPVTDESVAPLVRPMLDGATFRRRSVGCSSCRNGLTGMVPILEYINWQESDSRVPAQSLKELALTRAAHGEVDAYEAMAV